MIFGEKYCRYGLLTFSLLIILSACSPAPQPTEAVVTSTISTVEAEAPQSTTLASVPPPGVQQTSETVHIPEVVGESEAVTEAVTTCEPTVPDMLGPFYERDAPVRNSVGEGYVLSGTVRSSEGCSPIPEARIEFWLAGPGGEYGDEYRATVIANENGAYQFESNVPPGYSGRPPHIHIRVTAPGFQELVTQHYPQQGQTEASFDLVVQP